MNKDLARDKSIPDYLASKGYSKAPNSTSNNYFYYSPFTNEKEPSFTVRVSKNRWKDFSSGKSGDIIDLVMELENKSFTEALEALLDSNLPKPLLREESRVTVLKTGNIIDSKLINYLTDRRIDLDLARKYCKEVDYRVNGNGKMMEFKSIGFENVSGGWEFRDESWKGGSSPKDISVIMGDMSKTNLFEGFFDFLSYLMYKQITEVDYHTVVLNTTTLKDRVGSKIIDFYCDKGKAGDEVLEYYQSRNRIVNDKRDLFGEYEDFNDFWVNKI